MVLSWALTEVIRYTFYAATLVGWEPAPLVWARYSTFFVLYPTGAGSEALVNLATLPLSVASGGTWFSTLPLALWDAYALLRAALFIAWWPGESSFPTSTTLSLDSLLLFVHAFADADGAHGMILCRFVSDVYAYDQTTPQSVQWAEAGRKAQDALTHTRTKGHRN
jgi:Protein tyrosine phosphatase-like protein, PTPLA